MKNFHGKWNKWQSAWRIQSTMLNSRDINDITVNTYMRAIIYKNTVTNFVTVFNKLLCLYMQKIRD